MDMAVCEEEKDKGAVVAIDGSLPTFSQPPSSSSPSSSRTGGQVKAAASKPCRIKKGCTIRFPVCQSPVALSAAPNGNRGVAR